MTCSKIFLVIRGQTPGNKGTDPRLSFRAKRCAAPVISSEAKRSREIPPAFEQSAGVEKPGLRVPRPGAGGGAGLSREAIKKGRRRKERGVGETQEATQETLKKCTKSETFCVYQSEKSKPIKLYRRQIKNLQKTACRTRLLLYLKSR